MVQTIMSATRLLVLAFVRAYGRAHGYLVGQQLLAWNADKWSNTKTGSIYHALRQLDKEGHLQECEIEAPETTATPAPTKYRITEAGETAFHELLAKALTQPDPRPDAFCAGLVLMSALPRAEVLRLLRVRLQILADQKEDVDRANAEASEVPAERWLAPHVDALLDFWTAHTRNSHDWVAGLIARIEAGAYVFADEDPQAFATPGSLLVSAD